MRSTLGHAFTPPPARRVAVVAVVIAACAAFLHYGLPAPTPRPSTIAALQQPVQDHCIEGAALFHDVQWAAACSALAQHGGGDGHAECELPGHEAERLNRLLQQAEQRCASEASRSRMSARK